MMLHVDILLSNFYFSCGMHCWLMFVSLYQIFDCWFFPKGILHRPVLWYLIPVIIYLPFGRMCNGFLLKIAWQPASHNFPMEINVVCVSTGRICHSLEIMGSCGNARLHDIDDCTQPLLGSPIVMGGGGDIPFSHEGSLVWCIPH